MTMSEGTLTWPYAPLCTATDLGITGPQYQMAVDQAVAWMWARSGRRFGTRPAIYRPASRATRAPLLPVPGLQPVGSGYLVPYNVGDWAIETDQAIELPGPVVSVESVALAGVTLDPGLWRAEGNWLVRQDGGFWPRTQNLIAPLGAPDTWVVNYTRGNPVDEYGQIATGRLICYFGGQLKAGKPCQLPYNTTSVSRAGVTVSRDATKATKTTPVPEVDQWLALVNPNDLQGEPQVWSPDVERHRRFPYGGSYLGTTPPQGIPAGGGNPVLVLGPTDPVPAGTAVGTVILRTQ